MVVEEDNHEESSSAKKKGTMVQRQFVVGEGGDGELCLCQGQSALPSLTLGCVRAGSFLSVRRTDDGEFAQQHSGAASAAAAQKERAVRIAPLPPLPLLLLPIHFILFDRAFASSTMASIAEWDNEYARLARVASQLRSGVGVADASALPVQLQRLDAALQQLPLPPTEVQRRRRLIQHLQQTTTGSAAASSGVTAASSPTQPPQQAQTQMQLAMQQQDALIDDLAVGVGRLKHQTHAIHDEAGMHVNLLTEMESNLDSAQQGLEEETRRAARLKEDQSVWRLQLIVAGLSILLVLEILMGLSP